MISDKQIEKATKYIFGDEEEEEKEVVSLKIKVVEGNNGTYYIEDNGVRLERKNAYVLFSNKQELDAWAAEFEQVFQIAT